MTQHDQTADAFFATLTGFDELAIVKHFDTPIHLLHPDTGGSPFMFLRALAFIAIRRGQQLADKPAYTAAMGLSVDEANTYFAEAELPDLDPDDPDTAAGKADTPSD